MAANCNNTIETFKDALLEYAEKTPDSNKIIIPKENFGNIENLIKETFIERQKPKKAPNAFLLFKNHVRDSTNEDELKGRGALARIAKQKWDNMDDSEREPFVREYSTLKQRQDNELKDYYNYFGVTIEEIELIKKRQNTKVSLNPDGTKKKRGRPRKNPDAVVVSKNKRTKKGKNSEPREIVSDSDSEETGFVSIEYEGNDYLWDKSTDEVFDENGNCVGRKTKNGIAKN